MNNAIQPVSHLFEASVALMVLDWLMAVPHCSKINATHTIKTALVEVLSSNVDNYEYRGYGSATEG